MERGLDTSFTRGLTILSDADVKARQELYGANEFPAPEPKTWFGMFLESFEDTTVIVLCVASLVSLAVGLWEDYTKNTSKGWIEGTAILFAVVLVAVVTASNNYNKENQFRKLNDRKDDVEVVVVRNGEVKRISCKALVVGDVCKMEAGDKVPADALLISGSDVSTNESALTGEPEDVQKTTTAVKVSAGGDPFLISGSTLSTGTCSALIIATGANSRWGKSKSKLERDAPATPLQEKLETLANQIGYFGMAMAACTFAAMVYMWWAYPLSREEGQSLTDVVLEAFIMAVTIVVVAVPEGLPLAVTLSLAYSTQKMMDDNNLIRVLEACETMGNATNICSDKTGTLTENSMTVIEGWVADKMHFAKEELHGETSRIPVPIQCLLAENISTNRTAYLTSVGKDGEPLSSPAVIGSKTEGALLLLIDSWKFDYEDIKAMVFDEMRDAYYGFDSVKKRSTSIIFRPDGSVRIFVKGASEQLLRECSMYTTESGVVLPMSEDKYTEIESAIEDMASRALRTLVLAHKDIAHVSMLEYNWRADPPDSGALCVDAVVGIMDPLRDDVTDAVNLAQSAGVFVRMVTGDNINTACAIAKQCGILTRGGLAIEGPTFRALRPRDLDEILPRLQVMARASPDDKMLLVMRLNGHGVPKTREQWESRVHGTYQRTDLTWDLNKDDALPGNFAEWKASRPEGGHVVSVTGDGTNDAPALKAADVGLAMGITGTKVAQSAADIVVLDDRFSSIVGAISWGRCVYDNIRKFLQFQLTTNIVALILVFAAAVSGAQQPITAVQMLWVNLIMDTLGALALGTETPTPSLLKRKPYTRTASLISYPMLRNMAFQCSLQLGLCFWLMYSGPAFFKIRSGKFCGDLRLSSDSTTFWELGGLRVVNGTAATAGQWDLSCSSFKTYCSSLTLDCAERSHLAAQGTVRPEYVGTAFTFSSLPGFYSRCTPLCNRWDFTHGTIIFNTFIWCQIFNEFVSRMLGDELNMFDGIENNRMFLLVSIITIGMQIFIVEVCGAFMQTSGLTANQWLITIGLGAITLPVGVLMRLVKVPENPKDFFDMGMGESLNKKDASGNYARIAKGGSAELLTTLRGLEVARKANYNAKANYAAPLPGSNKFCITDDGVVKLVSALPSKTTLLQGGIIPTTTSTSTSASATASTGDKPRKDKSLSV